MILRELLQGAALSTVLFGGSALAGLPELDVNDVDSIKTVAATVAFDTMSYYNENQTGMIPGKLVGTWWEGGFLFNMLMQYWWYTGDTSYNPTVLQGMYWQAGADADYMPANWSSYLGNDDQVFWGLAAMTGAEMNFEEQAKQPSWLALAQGVFNTQAQRWDTSSCGGGLRWQLNTYQGGYTLKNSVSNGGFFQLAARLALYTGNSTYADWANKMWDWCAQSPLLNEQTWNIADSTETGNNCTTQGNLQWTYNYGVFLMGSAFLYNYTNGSTIWENRVNGIMGALTKEFLRNGILQEPACDRNKLCNRDQNCFKGLVSHYLAWTSYLVPSTYNTVVPILQASAQGAEKQCSGGTAGGAWPAVSNGRQCGYQWWSSTWDGSNGIEQEASVLSVMSTLLLGKTGGPPKTARTGGTSKSDPGAAGNTDDGNSVTFATITTGDRAGAAILTLLVLACVLGGGSWLVWP